MFSNVPLGDGGNRSLEVVPRYGWKFYANNVLIYGATFRPYHDAGISGFDSDVYIIFDDFRVNNFVEVEYQNAAKSYPDPSTRIIFRRGSMFATPDATPIIRYKGKIEAEFENVDFLGISDAGTVYGADAGVSGRIAFMSCTWEFLPFFGTYQLFDANFSGVTVEWLGRNIFTEKVGGFSPVAFDFSNIGAQELAPELITSVVPINPAVGTRRRDVGGTEKDLFWNGAAWV
jgi:hypothetical protein